MTKHWFFAQKPYAVQEKALASSWRFPAWGYLLDPGMGKTKITLTDFYRHFNGNFVDTMIVLCPNSLKENWRIEFNEMVQENTDIKCYVWPTDKKTIEYAQPNRVIIMNYEAINTRVGQEILTKYLQRTKVFLVLDESTRIKNPKSLTAKTLITPLKDLGGKSISQMAVMRRVLTGTPMTNTVQDYYPLIKFLYPQYPYNAYGFKVRFGIMGGYMGKQITGVRNEQELRNTIDSMCFSAKKEDYLDLPDKVYETRYFVMEGAHKEAYRTMQRSFMLQLEDKQTTAQIAISQLQKLLQISRGFVLNDEGESQEIVPFEDNPVYKVINEIIDATLSKIVIFCKHRYFGAKLLEKLSEKYFCAFIFGGMKPEEISEQKFNFNEKDAKIIICQIQAGAYGHTLTAGGGELGCYTCIFAENTYSLELRLQAVDRIHRISQTQTCIYYDIVGTQVDKKISLALQKKQKLVNSIEGIRELVKE